jgi:hypothetical protein
MATTAQLTAVCDGTGLDAPTRGIVQKCAVCENDRLTDTDGVSTWFVPHPAKVEAVVKEAARRNMVWKCDGPELANALGSMVKDLVGNNTVKVEGTMVVFYDEVGINTETRLKLESLSGGVLQVQGSMDKEAHDSGDGETIYHCPFCGSGQVLGRSDGTATCDFCDTAFTVQVQPDRSSQPQTIDGQPVDMPGMPHGGDQPPVDPNAPLDDPGAPKPPNAPLSVDGAPDAPAAPKPPGKQPPWLKGAARYYMTADQVALEEDAYLRHLAIKFADDRLSVIATVREENERKANNG